MIYNDYEKVIEIFGNLAGTGSRQETLKRLKEEIDKHYDGKTWCFCRDYNALDVDSGSCEDFALKFMSEYNHYFPGVY